MSVQYGTHVRTILLITVNGGTTAWGRGNYVRLDVEILLRWIILITRLGSLPLGGVVKA